MSKPPDFSGGFFLPGSVKFKKSKPLLKPFGYN